MTVMQAELSETPGPGEFVSYGRRVTQLAAEHPDKTAIVFAPEDGEERPISWSELDKTSNRIARLLEQHGVTQGSMVVIGLPNSPEHYFVTYAAWKLGALVLPVRTNLPARERDQTIEVAEPAVTVADWEGLSCPQITSKGLDESLRFSDESLPDRVAHPGKSTCSGGSTGRPKVIVNPGPWGAIPGDTDGRNRHAGFRSNQVQLVSGALYHNSPFSWSHYGLFEDHTIVLMTHFDAVKVVDLIERYKVNFAFLAPTMMKRIIDLPDVTKRDFSSIQAIFQTAAPCPVWLKRTFMDLIGPEKLYESFGSTEAIGSTHIRGDEWLDHPGSVGTPSDCEMKILDENRNEVPSGTVGDVFFRLFDREPTYYYIGSQPLETTADGFSTVGDMGWVDEQGYLFLADRRVDLIISGGANIFPAEVEAAVTEHPDVADVVVIGVPDEDWGRRVHAIVEPRNLSAPPHVGDLDSFCRERIASYKVPKTYEFVESLPRDGAGKIRRKKLVEEHSGEQTDGIIWVRRAVSNS